ncbi:MAG: DUF192 domain-containing protein [Thermodesulfovibrionales bacterium]|nr:DUF192 domain-containing protein [Thermodesulfovibrionales bacterium]
MKIPRNNRHSMKGFQVKKGLLLLFVLGVSLLISSHVFAYTTEVHANIHTVLLASGNGPQFTKGGELLFFSKTGGKRITIDIEIPDTREERSRGLMYRRSMADTEGMLFVHNMPKGFFFWMKNTYIPLDMIFVDKRMQIIQIEKNTTPLSEEPIFVPAKAQYTIEVNAGFCDRHGIKTGDSIQMRKIP